MAVPRTPVPSTPPRPAMDEWGVYDPQQAGLSALFARLEPTQKTPDAGIAKPAADKDNEKDQK